MTAGTWVYLGIATAIAVAALGLILWRNRTFLSSLMRRVSNRQKGTRRGWGRFKGLTGLIGIPDERAEAMASALVIGACFAGGFAFVYRLGHREWMGPDPMPTAAILQRATCTRQAALEFKQQLVQRATMADWGWRLLTNRCSEIAVQQAGWYLLPLNEGRHHGVVSLGGGPATQYNQVVTCCDASGRQFDCNGAFTRVLGNRLGRWSDPAMGPFYVLYRPQGRRTPRLEPLTLDLQLTESDALTVQRQREIEASPFREPSALQPAIQCALERSFTKAESVSLCLLPPVLAGKQAWYEVSIYFLPPLAPNGTRRLPTVPYPGPDIYLEGFADAPKLSEGALTLHPPLVLLQNATTGDAIRQISTGGDSFLYDSARLQELAGEGPILIRVASELPCTVQAAIAVWYRPEDFPAVQ
ncbi:MAG: hypothetical protein COT71_02590 [Candidatus Andersenbacteria bacterium CG10_big_fil_rev_8_21_14_0_10_54_11]|uniref:Uncharacterized protein n=1 Tax=Candidatus Andersenbacteria bacterium CG10_big_fil_rev_8_21_14_0_10_54_11 TaxID=1974485 RepID=A0A2M6WZ38_9BACT|nr:MAG: hypothetical protein COT71_02590 [Candidatus Andersenbacteria bacterium CG10_big_fil_rev_8_21_14_0_10_54_11]